MSLKALAEAVLVRNSQCNPRATETEETRNFSTDFDGEKLRDISQDDDGILWAEIEQPEAVQSRETRRERVLAMLAKNPNLQHAYFVEPHAYPSAASVFIADRNKSFELLIPRKWFDPFAVAELVRSCVR